jgi:putative sterol carrier protein
MSNFNTPDEVFLDMDRRLGTEISSLAGVTANYLFKLSGQGGGSFHILVKDGRGSAGAGAIDDPDLTFAVSAEDFVAMVRGDLDGVLAFMTGKLTMRGDQTLALPLALPLAPFMLKDADWHLGQNDVPL